MAVVAVKRFTSTQSTVVAMDSSSVPAQTAPTPPAELAPPSLVSQASEPTPSTGSTDAEKQVKRQQSADALPQARGGSGSGFSGRGGGGSGSGSGASRPKQASPPPNSCVVLKNLDYGITAHELENVVREITGDRKSFVNVSLVEDRNTKSFRGMAFVNFHSVNDAQKWLPQLAQLRVNNRKVYAEFRRMRPGVKERREARVQRSKGSYNVSQFKRSTFEDDIVSRTDENGNELDVRASFFAARENVKKAESYAAARAPDTQNYREKELEADFRVKLVEYRDGPVPEGEEIQDVVFDQDLSSYERRIVHVLCDELGLGHVSRSVDGARLLFVTKDPGRKELWEVETADARKAAAEKAAEKAALAEEKKKKSREAQERARLEGAANGRSSSPDGKVIRSKSDIVSEAAAHGVLLRGPATEEELKAINWSKFRPKSAMTDKDGQGGEGTVGMLSKPSYKVYIPPRQPTGPDGTIGFTRRNANGSGEGLGQTADENPDNSPSKPGSEDANRAAKPDSGSDEGGSSGDMDTTGSGSVADGMRSFNLNPNVPAFEFPGAL